MNTYLLLRDNRKSGPFTAEDLSAMGLKPYDLVWLEGKSAAWRYPGEIDELKPFAPAVEEQPYDRFYKKPVAQSRYAPKPQSDASVGQKQATGGKVYVRIPLSSSPATSVSQNFSKDIVPENPSTLNSLPFPERVTSPELKKDHTRVERNSLNRLLPIWITGMVILAALSIFLFINYLQQNKRLNQLSNLVLDMQQAQPPATSPYNKNVAALLPEIKDPSLVHALADSSATTLQSSIPNEVSYQTAVVNPKKNSQKKPAPNKDSITKKPLLTSDPDLVNTTLADLAPAKEQHSEASIRSALELSSNDYKIGLFGGISNLELTLKNNSPVDLSKVIVHIEYLGPDEKVLREQTASFHDVTAGKSFTEKLPKSGRGVSVRFRIKSVDPV